MFAAGKCWKRNGWILSLYSQAGDQHATFKVRRIKPIMNEKNPNVQKY